MPKFAANLSMFYPELPLLERFAAARRDGFTGIEYLSPYEHDPAEIRLRLDDAGQRQILFNAALGDVAAGEFGLAALPGRADEFRRSIDTALEYARIIGNKLLHVMAGVVPADGDPARYRATYMENLAHAAAEAASSGVTILIEPINTRDRPGYFLYRQDAAQAIRRELALDNLQVLFDCYHCQIVEGDLAMKLERDIAGIGHVQIAGVPARNEPDTGEVNYPFIFDTLERLGYQGWVGCEYRPKADTSAGLGWLARQRAGQG